MADVRPITALHYELNAVSSLADVIAPPYDVIDDAQRAALIARSAFNAVEIDLPVARDGGDPYLHAAETLEAWTLQGILTADREPALWAIEQQFSGPDGIEYNRKGFLARVRAVGYGSGGVRPHERTQPGPKEDRLRLTEATRHNVSPIFALHGGDAWSLLKPALGEAWGEATDEDGTRLRVWRVGDPAVHEAVGAALADEELLIADGHHRYETARTYADGIGGEGPHRYTLACLVSLDDPGLAVFATHRLLKGLDSEAQEALGAGLKELFEIEEVPVETLDPAGEEGNGVFGYIDAYFRQGFRLRLRDRAVLEGALRDSPDEYRRLDAVILEALVLKGILGMTEESIAAKRGIGYVKSAAEAVNALDEGWQGAFLLRPTPVAQVRAVAEAGATMPPKSTYFFPKIPTGIAFNPLS